MWVQNTSELGDSTAAQTQQRWQWCSSCGRRDVIRASDLSAVSMASLMHHLYADYYTSNRERARAGGWDLFIYFKRMKRRVYVKLFIFCMMNNGQVLTHTLKGRVEAVGDEFPERLWLHKTALFFHSSAPRRHRCWWDLTEIGVCPRSGTEIHKLICESWTCHTHAHLLDLLSDQTPEGYLHNSF